jgi:hypothetical protein
MATSGLHGVLDAATGSAHTDHVTRHAGLRYQIVEGYVDVSGALLDLGPGCFGR